MQQITPFSKGLNPSVYFVHPHLKYSLQISKACTVSFSHLSVTDFFISNVDSFLFGSGGVRLPWAEASNPPHIASCKVWTEGGVLGGILSGSTTFISGQSQNNVCPQPLPDWVLQIPSSGTTLLAKNSLRYAVVPYRHKLLICILLCSVLLSWGHWFNTYCFQRLCGELVME